MALPTRSSTSSRPIRVRRSSSTTTTSISRRGTSGTGVRMLGSCISSTSRGSASTAGASCPPTCAGRCTTACWRTTSSAFTRSAGAGCSPRRLRQSRAVRRRRSLARSRWTRRSWMRFATDDAVIARRDRLRRERPERLVVRVDRTDPSKNILRGFRAFELLLERHPEHLGRVGMLALLDPSRQDIPEYAEYLAEIEHAAAEVNERAGADGDRPPDRGRLPALGRRLHGVRRAVREPDLRRAQPRREGRPAAE